jgi:hypothetical protein
MSALSHKTKEEVKYGLWHKKEECMLTVNVSSNEGSDFCIDVSHNLTTYGDQIWYVDNPYVAEYVRNFSTEWYNASYGTPSHEFDADELVVVRVKISTDYCQQDISVPTMEEYLKIKYSKTNPGHYKYCMDQLKKYIRHSQKYSMYDLLELIEKGEWPKGDS